MKIIQTYIDSDEGAELLAETLFKEKGVER
jgi:hypothetical protein